MSSTTTSTTDSAGLIGRGDDTGLDLVTGAFSYSGRASPTCSTGRPAGTDPHRASRRAGDRSEIEVRPLDFDDPVGLSPR